MVVQISAFISRETRERLERYADAHGLKKAAIIEAALLYHFQALDELPVDVFIPPRLLVTSESFQQIVDAVEHPPAPTASALALMRGEPVEGLDD